MRCLSPWFWNETLFVNSNQFIPILSLVLGKNYGNVCLKCWCLCQVNLTEVRVATPMTDCAEHGARSVFIGNTTVKIRVSSAPSDIKIIVVLATHGLSFLRRA